MRKTPKRREDCRPIARRLSKGFLFIGTRGFAFDEQEWNQAIPVVSKGYDVESSLRRSDFFFDRYQPFRERERTKHVAQESLPDPLFRCQSDLFAANGITELVQGRNWNRAAYRSP